MHSPPVQAALVAWVFVACSPVRSVELEPHDERYETCGRRSERRADGSAVAFAATVHRIRDDTAVDGDVRIVLIRGDGEPVRAIFGSLYTSPPPSAARKATYDTIHRSQGGRLRPGRRHPHARGRVLDRRLHESRSAREATTLSACGCGRGCRCGRDYRCHDRLGSIGSSSCSSLSASSPPPVRASKECSSPSSESARPSRHGVARSLATSGFSPSARCPHYRTPMLC